MLALTNDTITAVADVAEDLETAIRALKEERDTWRAVAESYQAAFLTQTAHLRELQDICVATQAELENERTTNRRSQAKSDVSQASLCSGGKHTTDGTDDKLEDTACGTATIYESNHDELSWRPNFCFARIEHFANQRDYGTALKEIDHLLRGSLTPQARIEGLLLKSNIMRKSDWLYDALAACSEALELCNRLEELQAYLPKIQYQRGICYYQLQMTGQARDAFSEVCADDNLLYAKASELRDFCEDQLQDRRSGFEAHRTVTEGLLAQLHDSRAEVSSFILFVCCHVLMGVVEAASRKSATPDPRIKGEAALFASRLDHAENDVAWDELTLKQRDAKPQHPSHNAPDRNDRDINQTVSSSNGPTARAPTSDRAISPPLKDVKSAREFWETRKQPTPAQRSVTLQPGPIRDEQKVPFLQRAQKQDHGAAVSAAVKGDVLDPKRKQPWEARTAKDSGNEEAEGSEDHSRPPEAQSPHDPLLPPSLSAFEWALSPWLKDHPEYELAYSPPASSNLSSPLPLPQTPPDAGEVSAASDEVFPDIQYETGIAPFVAHKDKVHTRIRVLQVRTALIRCAILSRSARELEHGAEWKGSKPAYKEYSKMNRVVDKAGQMAEELGSHGLQARCWYWKGRACGGQRYWDEAVKAFEKACYLDPLAELNSSALHEDGESDDERVGAGAYGRSGLTPLEKSDVRFLLESVKKKDKMEFDKRYKRRMEDRGEMARLVGMEEYVKEPWDPHKERIDADEVDVTNWEGGNSDDGEETIFDKRREDKDGAFRKFTDAEWTYINKEVMLEHEAHDNLQSELRRAEQAPRENNRVS
ncbi:hypothetical protein N0V90_003868 [Kalmusia sp. IMI 367209]|nr:hypothetical protein N0V90_003868 [Kalmusia sp. IMI 367209]